MDWLTLIQQARQGDKQSRDTIIEENMGLVHHIVKRFLNRGYDAEELFQIGCIGLMKAVDHFDTGYDVKFSTYAVPMIIGEIRRYLRDNNMLRVSRGTRDLAYKALTARESLSKKLSREPTIKDIAEETGESEKDISDALDAIMAPVSLYDPVYSDNSGDSIYVMDQIKDENNSDESWLESIALSEAMKKLSEREKKIIALRFYRGKTQMEIADEIGISQAQVSRIEKGALERIKKQI